VALREAVEHGFSSAQQNWGQNDVQLIQQRILPLDLLQRPRKYQLLFIFSLTTGSLSMSVGQASAMSS
jgi:hypothetical protein